VSVAACRAPVDLQVLLDYWLADLPPGDEERVEEHLLGCPACSGRMADLAALAAGIRRLGSQGLVRAVVTADFLRRLVDEGARVREYRLAPGGSVQCTVEPQDDLVVTRLAADLAGIGRLDLVSCDAEGREQGRLEDIPVAAAAREVVLVERIDRIRALPESVQRVRLVAREAEGDRLLGEYTFHHTPPRSR